MYYPSSFTALSVSVSIPEEDVEFLDHYVKTHHIESRSAAMQRAIRPLRASELRGTYAVAFTEWVDDPPSDAWDTAVAIANAPPRNPHRFGRPAGATFNAYPRWGQPHRTLTPGE